MTLLISPRKIARFLTILIVAIAVIGTTAESVRQATQSWSHKGVAELAGKLTLDSELSFPAWYSSVVILVCAGLLAVIATAKRRARSPFARHWIGLAVVFLLLSIDEMAALHEMFIVPLRRHFGAHGLLSHAWVIPAFLFVTGFGIAYLRFVFVHLDARTRRRFIAAGLIYIAAALGLEVVEGPIDERFGTYSLPGRALVTVEETCEMLGIVVFLYALLGFIADHVGDLQIRFAEETVRHESPETDGRGRPDLGLGEERFSTCGADVPYV